MSEEPNRMSTQDDPEIFPWQNAGMTTGGGMVYSNKIHSSFLVNQNIVHSSWLSAASDAPDGAQAPLAARRAQIGGRHPVRYSRRTVTFITPGTASMTFGPHHTELNVSNILLTNRARSLEGNHEVSPIPASPEGSTPHAEPCKTFQGKADWVEQLSWGIPKQLREQIVGDLCEIRAKMAAEGCSSPQIMWTTLSQLLWSIPWWLWSRFGWIVLLYNRVSEWLSPSK